jgi:hypothetical protein
MTITGARPLTFLYDAEKSWSECFYLCETTLECTAIEIGVSSKTCRVHNTPIYAPMFDKDTPEDTYCYLREAASPYLPPYSPPYPSPPPLPPPQARATLLPSGCGAHVLGISGKPVYVRSFDPDVPSENPSGNTTAEQPSCAQWFIPMIQGGYFPVREFDRSVQSALGVTANFSFIIAHSVVHLLANGCGLYTFRNDTGINDPAGASSLYPIVLPDGSFSATLPCSQSSPGTPVPLV